MFQDNKTGGTPL